MAVRGWETTAAPNSDPQPCSRGEEQGGKAKGGFLSNSDPTRHAGRRAGGREDLSGSPFVSEKQGAAAIFENRGKQELSSSGQGTTAAED